jgi:UDP-2,3-diacylglucosamine hydrolase
VSSSPLTREVVAPPSWRRIDFISDLHLAAGTPLAFAAWRDYLLNAETDAIFILGDLFEAWIGDDARHDGFEAKAAATLTQAAARRPLYFMVGNRDFLLGSEMLSACGVEGLDDPCLLDAFGERALLSHGDAWCLDDVVYQRFRSQVRNPSWQSQVLSRPLTERRLMATSMRSESERAGGSHDGAGFDLDAPVALRAMVGSRANTLVHGHTHRPGSNALAPGLIRHVLSDWDLDHALPVRAEVLRWDAGHWTRLMPSAASVRST